MAYPNDKTLGSIAAKSFFLLAILVSAATGIYAMDSRAGEYRVVRPSEEFHLFPPDLTLKSADKMQRVSAVLPQPPEVVVKIVQEMFRTRDRSRRFVYHNHFDRFGVVEEIYEERSLPESRKALEYMVRNSDSKNTVRINTDLRRFVELKENRKGIFLYLDLIGTTEDDSSYWYSEYYVKDNPVRFRCRFAVYVEKAAQNRSYVEILEYLPMVRVGGRLGFPHDSGILPGMIYDQRWVAPTTKDKKDLLNLIRQFLPGGKH